MGWNKKKKWITKLVDGSLRGDGLNERTTAKAVRQDDGSKVREVRENEEGSEIYIGWKMHKRRSDTLTQKQGQPTWATFSSI